MQLFVPRQHGDELLNALCSGFRLLCGLKAVDDGVGVALVQCFEKCFCFPVLTQLSQKIIRRHGVARRVIGSFPPTVKLRRFDGFQSRWSHLAGFHQAFGVLSIDLRPPAPGASGSEPLEPGVLVKLLFLTVDPPIAKRLIEGLGVSYGRLAGPLLIDSQPYAIGLSMVLGKPTAKFCWRLEADTLQPGILRVRGHSDDSSNRVPTMPGQGWQTLSVQRCVTPVSQDSDSPGLRHLNDARQASVAGISVLAS
jgi:hypothetical protein